MKTTLLAGALALASMSAVAKDKLIPLSAADAAALKDKTVAVTLHETPDFGAMTAGKAAFGLFGAAAMIKAGNDMVRENGIADPAILVRQQLGDALRQTYGAQVQAVDATATKAKKPKEIAAVHPEADYVLDVRSGNWMYVYYPSDWNNYQVIYSVQAQLVAKDGRQVSNAACTASSKANKTPPSRDQLLADGAKLIKDYSTAMAWNCVQILATNQFMVPLDKFAGVPQPYAELIARFTAEGQAPVKAAEASAAAAAAAAPAPAAAPTAEPAAATEAPTPAPVKSEGEG